MKFFITSIRALDSRCEVAMIYHLQSPGFLARRQPGKADLFRDVTPLKRRSRKRRRGVSWTAFPRRTMGTSRSLNLSGCGRFVESHSKAAASDRTPKGRRDGFLWSADACFRFRQAFCRGYECGVQLRPLKRRQATALQRNAATACRGVRTLGSAIVGHLAEEPSAGSGLGP
jgi:hypothetical protein